MEKTSDWCENGEESGEEMAKAINWKEITRKKAKRSQRGKNTKE